MNDHLLSRRRRGLSFSGRVVRWVYLVTVALAAVVLAAVAEFLPPRALADHGVIGVGGVAACGVVAAGAGVISALAGGLAGVVRRWPPLLLLMVVNAVVVVLFPPHWLLGMLQSDRAIFFVETDRDQYALTIDDGIDPATTPAILDTLAAHGARATFFVLGSSLDANRPLVRRLLADGHELANHQWTDTPAIALSASELDDEVRRANARLSDFATPAWFRPGGGYASEDSAAIARRLRLRTALGSVFPFDSHLGWTPFLAAYVEGRTGRGSLVILHDRAERGRRTAAILRRVLPRLKERGLTAVTLSELAR